MEADMSASIKIVSSNIKSVLAALSGDTLGRAVMAGGFVIEGAAKVSMAQGGKGQLYGNHRASKPGDPPAIDLGTLVNSINTVLKSSSTTDAWANVGTGVEYAPHLEFGTSRMEARPFLRPAWDNNIDKVKGAMRHQLKGAIEQATR